MCSSNYLTVKTSDKLFKTGKTSDEMNLKVSSVTDGFVLFCRLGSWQPTVSKMALSICIYWISIQSWHSHDSIEIESVKLESAQPPIVFVDSYCNIANAPKQRSHKTKVYKLSEIVVWMFVFSAVVWLDRWGFRIPQICLNRWGWFCFFLSR